MPLKTLKVIRAFQSTLPRGERLGTITEGKVNVDFNPRSRVGSDYVR